MATSLPHPMLEQLDDINVVNGEFEGHTHQANSVHLLSFRSFIRLHGVDAAKFMQGQLTCDVNTLDKHASRGAHCTPKGRAIATFVVTQTQENDYLFSLPADNRQALLKSLGKYIVFSKAKVEQDDQRIALGLMGDHTADFINEYFGHSETNLRVTDAGIAYSIDEHHVELWLNEAQLIALWPAIHHTFTPASNHAWLNAEINAGRADVTAATRDEFVPQMLGLKEDDGISYKKGCYTGQEIVARLHFLGKQKRNLYRFAHEQAPIHIASKVHNTEGKDLGTVVSLSNSDALAVLSRAEDTISLVIDGKVIAAHRCHQDSE